MYSLSFNYLVIKLLLHACICRLYEKISLSYLIIDIKLDIPWRKMQKKINGKVNI